MDSVLIEPSSFDLIVYGTGLIESIVAAYVLIKIWNVVMYHYSYTPYQDSNSKTCLFFSQHCSAAAKSGRSVLQLSPNAYYGDAWASLDLDSFCQAISQDNNATDPISLVKSSNNAWISPDIDLGSSRQYSIDLAPKVVMCAGKLIEILIASGSHNHTEFKHVNSTYIKMEDQLIKVPSSKSEIFKDRYLQLPQKRALMKFMTACSAMMTQQQEDIVIENDGRSLIDFMKDHGFDDVLQSLVLHGVLLNSNNKAPSIKQGLEMLKTHSLSVGRYGPGTGAYLTPMYGCGEICQALCRSAAVGGAMQALRCPIIETCSLLHEDDDEEKQDEYLWTVRVENGGGQELQCKAFFDGSTITQQTIYRCVAILDSPVIAGEGQSIIIIPSIMSETNSPVVWGMCLTHGTSVCPKGKAVLYLWTLGNNDNEVNISYKVLLQSLDFLTDTSQLEGYSRHDDLEGSDRQEGGKPKVLLAMCYNQKQKDDHFSLPDASLTYEAAIDIAKKAYFQLYPPSSQWEAPFPLALVVSDTGSNDGSDEDEELAKLGEILSKSTVVH